MNSSLSDSDIELLAKDLFDDVIEIVGDGIELRGIDYSVDHALNSLWLDTKRIGVEFEKRRDAFLWILARALREGRIKLHKDGGFLEGSVEEQVQIFRDAWPVSQRAADEIVWGKDSDQVGTNRMDLWFFMHACPAGVAWRRPDGSYQIAD